MTAAIDLTPWIRRAWLGEAPGFRTATVLEPCVGASQPPRFGIDLQRQDRFPLERDRAINGGPLRIAGQVYAHGLATHGESLINVHLGGPARTFEAVIGVDDSSGGTGAMAFEVVRPEWERLFRSEPLRAGAPGQRIAVELGGATCIRLGVWAGEKDCAFADWADAVVTMADGRRVRLDEIPDFVIPTYDSSGRLDLLDVLPFGTNSWPAIRDW